MEKSHQQEPDSLGEEIRRAVADEAGRGMNAFCTTRWSIVLAAGAPETLEHQAALETLSASYRQPVFTYFCSRGLDFATAEDTTQEFFIKLLSSSSLAGIDPSRGRFRSWIFAALRNHLNNHWRHLRAAKRGAGAALIPLEDAPETAAADEDDSVFDRAWAKQIIALARAALREEYASSDRLLQHDALVDHLTSEPGDYNPAALAAAAGTSQAGLKVALHRIRRRFGRHIVDQVELTVADPGELRDEVRHLFRILEKDR